MSNPARNLKKLSVYQAITWTNVDFSLMRFRIQSLLNMFEWVRKVGNPSETLLVGVSSLHGKNVSCQSDQNHPWGSRSLVEKLRELHWIDTSQSHGGVMVLIFPFQFTVWLRLFCNNVIILYIQLSQVPCIICYKLIYANSYKITEVKMRSSLWKSHVNLRVYFSTLSPPQGAFAEFSRLREPVPHAS